MRLVDDGAAVLALSPAKLNLLLAIHGRRPDGFHELETLMLKVSLFDTLRFSPRGDGEVSLRVRQATRGAPRVSDGPDNLIVRAAELLRHRAGIRFGTDILLEKRIPSEAGLAGGSGNAAAALSALNRLWRLGLTPSELSDLGARLGSDVPFFLAAASAAVARGRGEQIGPVSVAVPLHFVIVKPAFGLATAAVYRAFAEQFAPSGTGATPLVNELAAGRLSRAARLLHNDLAPAAESIRPELVQLRTTVQKECRYGGLMTGSGSACFGICGSSREARVAAARLRARGCSHVFVAMSA